MLERAKSESAGLPIRWVEGDARTFGLQEQFRFIFLTGNAFQAFVTNTEQAALLQRVYAHLHHEGLFAFETRNPLFSTTNTREDGFPLLETRNEDRPSFINADGQYGDWNGEPLSAASPSIISVCRKRTDKQ